ncbi:hypothetical protein G4228_019449 [Cervus hanglu yarkandensis]|nr:hypothetical protein G4228_019449 [Cervus hanglu yarkandensis]
MAKGDPEKPKGKMSAFAFFVPTCREEHKKNPEVPVNFAEFSKKCSESWKTMSGKEKTLSGFFLFCSEFCPKIKSTNPGISTGDVAKKLGEMWNKLSDSEKQLYINKFAKLKEKYEKDVADYKGEFDGTKGPAKVAWKKVEEKEDEEEEEEEDELKKTVDLSPCENLRVASTMIDTPLTQDMSVALIRFNYPTGS